MLKKCKLQNEGCPNFNTFIELRGVFPSVDQVEKFTIFNIGGNKARLIAAIHYNTQRVYIRHVLTHAEYDRNNIHALTGTTKNERLP